MQDKFQAKYSFCCILQNKANAHIRLKPFSPINKICESYKSLESGLASTPSGKQMGLGVRSSTGPSHSKDSKDVIALVQWPKQFGDEELVTVARSGLMARFCICFDKFDGSSCIFYVQSLSYLIMSSVDDMHSDATADGTTFSEDFTSFVSELTCLLLSFAVSSGFIQYLPSAVGSSDWPTVRPTDRPTVKNI